MKAYLSNGILLADRDSAVVYGNSSFFDAVLDGKTGLKSSLLPLDSDIDVKNRKANFFLHFDHPEFDPTANTEVYNSIEVEIGYNDGTLQQRSSNRIKPTSKPCCDRPQRNRKES